MHEIVIVLTVMAKAFGIALSGPVIVWIMHKVAPWPGDDD